MGKLGASLARLARGGQEPVHRALGGQVDPVIEERRVDRRRRGIDEARGMEHVQHRLPLRGTECPWMGLGCAGGGLLGGTILGRFVRLPQASPIEAGPRHAQRPAGPGHARHRR